MGKRLSFLVILLLGGIATVHIFGTGTAHADTLATWSFNSGSTTAQRLEASTAVAGVTVSSLTFNSSGGYGFSDFGFGAVPNNDHDGIGFGGNSGEQVMFLHRANYFDGSAVPSPRPTASDYTSFGSGASQGTTAGLGNGNAPVSFTVTATSTNIQIVGLTIRKFGIDALIFGFQEAGGTPGETVTVAPAGGTETAYLSQPVVVAAGENKTFTFSLNSGLLNSKHNVDYIELLYAIDTTAPTWTATYPQIDTRMGDGFIARAAINEPGKVYYVVVTDGATAPSAAEVKSGTGAGGSGALTSGSLNLSAADSEESAFITGLTQDTAYDVYFVAEDDESPTPNLQNSPVKIDISTIAVVELLAEDFESPDVSSADSDGDTSGAIPTGWKGATEGFGAGRRGVVDEAHGDFTDPAGKQAFAFRYTNSGLTSDVGAIGAAEANVTYTIRFDVVMDGHNNTTPYTAQFGTFADGTIRDNCQNTSFFIGGAPLASVSGDATADGNYTSVTFSYTIDPVADAAVLGEDLVLRFIGATDSAIIDNVEVTTPLDDTPPAWVSGWPTINPTNASGGTARARIDENGTAYYVILTGGADAPTAAQVTNGVDYGTVTVVTNGSMALDYDTEATADIMGLSDNTAYDVWFVAVDAVDTNTPTPNLQAAPVKVELTTTLSDSTAPGWTASYPQLGTPTYDQINLIAAIDEPGMAYYVVVADPSTPPSAANVRDGNDSDGSPALQSGAILLASADAPETNLVTGLSPTTSYNVYVVSEDDELTPNLQDDGDVAQLDVTTTSVPTNSMAANGTWTDPGAWSLVNVPRSQESVEIQSGVTATGGETSSDYTGSLTLRENAVLSLINSGWDYRDNLPAATSSPIYLHDGARLFVRQAGNNDPMSNPLVIDGDVTLEKGVYFNAGDWLINGVISGNGSITYAFNEGGGDRKEIFLSPASPSTYTGGTTIHDTSGADMRVVANADGAFGSGDLTIKTGSQVDLSGTSDVIADTAILKIEGTGILNLDGSNETVYQCLIDGNLIPKGEYTSIETWLQGTGILTVLDGLKGTTFRFK